ncbi:hypothetical protein SHIRM173S_08139 [Streptomyces hirsutus]
MRAGMRPRWLLLDIADAGLPGGVAPRCRRRRPARRARGRVRTPGPPCGGHARGRAGLTGGEADTRTSGRGCVGVRPVAARRVPLGAAHGVRTGLLVRHRGSCGCRAGGRGVFAASRGGGACGPSDRGRVARVTVAPRSAAPDTPARPGQGLRRSPDPGRSPASTVGDGDAAASSGTGTLGFVVGGPERHRRQGAGGSPRRLRPRPGPGGVRGAGGTARRTTAAMPGQPGEGRRRLAAGRRTAAAGGAVGARTVLVGAAGHRVPGSGQGAPRPGTEEVRRGGRRAGPRARRGTGPAVNREEAVRPPAARRPAPRPGPRQAHRQLRQPRRPGQPGRSRQPRSIPSKETHEHR